MCPKERGHQVSQTREIEPEAAFQTIPDGTD